MQPFTKMYRMLTGSFHPVTRFNMIHAIKITVAALAAIIIATALKLEYSGSCAVIALITVAATRKETFALSLKRLLTFLITIALSFLLYRLIGINYVTFGLLMFLLAVISYSLHMYGTISVNAVIATHVLGETDLTAAFALNETLLVLTGTMIAILLNLYMPDETPEIREAVTAIEKKEAQILHLFQLCLTDVAAPETLHYEIRHLSAELRQAKEYARRKDENVLAAHSAYYRDYMNMRSDQCQLLEQMAFSMQSVTVWPPQSAALGAIFEEISQTFHEYNNAGELLKKLETLTADLRQESLPITRTEFENRAILYHILLQLQVFLEIKQNFVAELTAEQLRIYWHDCE